MDIPVFNRNQGEIAASLGERMQAQHQREFVEANIKRDVTLAYRRYRAAAEALVLYATQIIPTAQKNLQAVRSAYNAGEFSIFDIVGEQRRLIENETAYNDVLTDYYSALADLERALGTTLPPSGFAPSPITVIPNIDGIDAGHLLRSLKSSAAITKTVDVRSELTPSTGAPRDATHPAAKMQFHQTKSLEGRKLRNEKTCHSCSRQLACGLSSGVLNIRDHKYDCQYGPGQHCAEDCCARRRSA